jgi:hypothetical protein
MFPLLINLLYSHFKRLILGQCGSSSRPRHQFGGGMTALNTVKIQTFVNHGYQTFSSFGVKTS